MNKRIIAVMLAILLLVGLMSGCDRSDGGKSSDDGSSNDRSASEYAYQANILPLSSEIIKGYTLTQISSFCVSGNTAYFVGDFVSEDRDSAAYIDPASSELYEDDTAYRTGLFAMDLATKEVTQVDYQRTELQEGREGSFSLSELCAGPDGTVWVVETAETYYFELPDDFDENTQSKWNYYMPSEPIVKLLQYGADGKQVSSTSIQVEGELGSYFSFMADLNGNVYCTDLTSVYIFGADGSAIGTLAYDSGYLIQLGVHGVAVLSYGIGGDTLINRIDPAAGAFLDPISVDHGSILPQTGNEKYLYTYVSNGKLFGTDAATNIAVEILDLLSCDINDSRVIEHSVLDDGRIVALQTVSQGSSGVGTAYQYDLVMVELANVSSMPEKQLLTLGCVQLENSMKDHIIQFNQSNDQVRIVVKDYASYGAQALASAMSSDNAPDLIMTDSLPVAQYASDGKLVDLWPLIENDGELSKNELMTHLFETASIDGKLYEAASAFSIYSAAGKAETVGKKTNWTLADLNSALGRLNDNATVFGSDNASESFLNTYLYQVLDQYVDWSGAAATFNDQRFADLLEFAVQLSDESIKNSEANNKKSGEYSRLYSNTQLLTTCYIDSFDQIKYANAMHRGEATFVGYPTENGQGNLFALIDPVAITSACDNLDAAWTFVRTFLTKDYQLQKDLDGFPTNKTAFDEYAKQEMTPEYQKNAEGEYILDETGNKIEVSSGSLRLEEILSLELLSVTKEEYDQFMALYESCSVMARANPDLAELITPEINSIFTEGSSVEDAALAVQTTVQAYLKENT